MSGAFFAHDAAQRIMPKTRVYTFVSASHQTSNLIDQTCSMDSFSYLSVLISIILALGMAGPGPSWRDAASALASPVLLGPRLLDRESVSVLGCGVVADNLISFNLFHTLI
jgi:hypothetical protein